MDDQDKNELNESAKPYGRNMQVRVFQSFEEMNEADAAEMAATPVERRIGDTVDLILRVYGLSREKLRGRPFPKTITITRNG